MKSKATTIQEYNGSLDKGDREICELLLKEINEGLPESTSKLWHGNPVWFLNENPIVGYAKLKDCIQLLFWSGQSFDEAGLKAEGSFKAAEARYTTPDQIHHEELKRWLKKAKTIQWDYKNIVKRRGVLEKIS
ncbi:DUF1801 domain-containing protein [Candidatus Woesebacteria bacterium]|nr:DUF1801 domain-containing protein [Candidatus Woesebacteria bacterium]